MLLANLNDFFGIVEADAAVDTTGVEPLAHPVGHPGRALRLRDDVASEPNQREANQRSAPAVERGLFRADGAQGHLRHPRLSHHRRLEDAGGLPLAV
jgi:aspartyl/glutamyl-tRNA(Asn/Gln) amidotransferase C subunit